MRWRESEYIKHNINKVGREPHCSVHVSLQCPLAALTRHEDRQRHPDLPA